jgi:hypothetical protein
MEQEIKISDLVRFNSVSKPDRTKKKGIGVVIDFSNKYETVFVYWLGRAAPHGWYHAQHLQALSEDEFILQNINWGSG